MSRLGPSFRYHPTPCEDRSHAMSTVHPIRARMRSAGFQPGFRSMRHSSPDAQRISRQFRRLPVDPDSRLGHLFRALRQCGPQRFRSGSSRHPPDIDEISWIQRLEKSFPRNPQRAAEVCRRQRLDRFDHGEARNIFLSAASRRLKPGGALRGNSCLRAGPGCRRVPSP